MSLSLSFYFDDRELKSGVLRRYGGFFPVLYEVRFDTDLKVELFACIALSLQYLLPSADVQEYFVWIG